MTVFAVLGTGCCTSQTTAALGFSGVWGIWLPSLFIPAFLVLFWERLTASGAFWGIVSGLIVSTPLSIFANVQDNPHLIVASSILGLLIGGVVAVAVSLAQPRSSSMV